MKISAGVLVYLVTFASGLPGVAYAQGAPWGVLHEIAVREWLTSNEPRPRVSKFQWQEEGRVLVARHGFVSRLQFGEGRFADTSQRFELNPKTGVINVTYTYEDGRPPLNTQISIGPDGTAVETFKQADGTEFRNTYRSPSLSINTILRERKEGGAWVTLGTTRKTGLTRLEIAENARRAEEARQMAMAQAQAREAQLAAEEAERNAELAAYEAEEAARFEAEQAGRQSMAQNGPNMLDLLNGIGATLQRNNEQRQAQFDRYLQDVVQDEARKKAEAARAEAQRVAAENSRRVQEANARQAAISQQYAQARSAGEAAPRDEQQAREAARQEQQRRADQQREREAQQARQEQQAQEAQKRRDDETRQRREQAEREAEGRRQAQERQRAAAEAERTRVIEFKEAVVLCSLSGPQAQFNNWRCEGPLQMTLVNFGQPNVGGHFSQMDCTNYRELPRAGSYRAFGCGYGIHPTNPGAARDVPAMLGVFVAGRITFRCPRNISGACRDQ